jgi:hypothetical protein
LTITTTRLAGAWLPKEQASTSINSTWISSNCSRNRWNTEGLSKQINVPGSFWQGRRLPDDRDTVYKCTIVGKMYWIDYPLPFLSFYYDTFPAVDDGLA